MMIPLSAHGNPSVKSSQLWFWKKTKLSLLCTERQRQWITSRITDGKHLFQSVTAVKNTRTGTVVRVNKYSGQIKKIYI